MKEGFTQSIDSKKLTKGGNRPSVEQPILSRPAAVLQSAPQEGLEKARELLRAYHAAKTPEERAWQEQRWEQEKLWREGKLEAPPGKMKIVLDQYHYSYIDTPEEKARKKERLPQEWMHKVNEAVHAYGRRPLTDEEWKALEWSPRHLDSFFDTLDAQDNVTLGHKREWVKREVNQRYTKRLNDLATDRHPDWWEVYDKNGNRIWKMSLMDKALLAKWRRFESLPPDEQYEILRREYAAMHQIPDDRPTEATAGEMIKNLLLAIRGFLPNPPKRYTSGFRARGRAEREPVPIHREAVIAVHVLSWVMTFKSDHAHSLAAMPRSSSPTALA